MRAPSFFRRHVSARVDGLRQFVGVVGIHHQGVRQLMAGAREAAQDQRALLVRRAATYSLATRFMPSCSEVTRQTSAAR